MLLLIRRAPRLVRHSRSLSSASELDIAIKEMNAEMAELFGTAMESGGPATAGGPASIDLLRGRAAVAPALSLASAASVRQSTEAAAVLHAKIRWAAAEIDGCSDAPRVTSLAECISACARAAADLGDPFSGHDHSRA
jgi:hypothetical protein